MIAIALISLATACGTSDGHNSPRAEITPNRKQQPVGGTIHTDTFVQGDLVGGYADILFVVDNSGSMSEEQTLLANSFNTFINWVITQKVDFHIAITTT